MAIINNKHKFIYIHIPKTAGTSISKFLEYYSTVIDIEIGGTELGEIMQDAFKARFGLSKHSSAQEIKNTLGDETWAKYMKFAIVREPIDRFVSGFNFLYGWQPQDIYAKKFTDKVRSFDSIDDFISSGLYLNINEVPENLFQPQVAWLMDDSNNFLVEKIIKMENVSIGLKSVMDNLNISHDWISRPLPNLNSSNPERDSFKKSSISPENIDALKKFYIKDFYFLCY